MNDIDLDLYKNFAEKAIFKAADLLLGKFRPEDPAELKKFYKSANALVTNADIESDKKITEILNTPELKANIYSEESEKIIDEKSNIFWLIDPLCGTVPYSLGMDHWGINIALRDNEKIILSCLSSPSIGEYFSVILGEEVNRNGKPYKSTSPTRKLSESTIVLEVDGGLEWAKNIQHISKWITKVSQVNSFSSIAYPMTQMALGRIPGGVFYGIDAVHFAAGARIVESLGILVTDKQGNNINWTKKEKLECVVVGWPEIHKELINLM
ncbi:MAG: inositol monophosphatase family protein [Dehalococcoidia bacterium]